LVPCNFNKVEEYLRKFTEENRHVIKKETKALEAFKLELYDIVKRCAAVTTASPLLLVHIANEARWLWENLEAMVTL